MQSNDYKKLSIWDKISFPFHKILLKKNLGCGRDMQILEKGGLLYIMVTVEQRGDIGNFIFKVDEFRKIYSTFEDMLKDAKNIQHNH